MYVQQEFLGVMDTTKGPFGISERKQSKIAGGRYAVQGCPRTILQEKILTWIMVAPVLQ